MQETMKSCPFCGGGDVYIKYNGSKHGRFYYVECDTCGGRTRGVCLAFSRIDDDHEWDNPTAQQVIRLWNRRVADAEQDH
jgi:Lar family restriction alleviation protein